MRKFICVAIASIIISSAAMFCGAAETITRDQLAELLLRTLGLESSLPANMNDLSAADAYAQMVKLLADNGITSFNGTTSDMVVTRGDLAQAIYDALSAKDPSMKKGLSQNGIVQLMSDRGLMEIGAVSDMVNEAMLLDALNNPMLLEDIALAYQRPASSVE